MPQYIESKDNPKLKQLRGLIEHASLRKKQQQTVLEGAHLIESYLHSGKQPDCIFSTEQGLNHPKIRMLSHPPLARFILFLNKCIKVSAHLGKVPH